MKLPTHAGDINIMEESAFKYRDVGTVLLNDGHGVRVETVTQATKGDTVEAIRMIYTRWIREDVGCSWLKLTQCFRDCGLNNLANTIEQHVGLPSPQQPQKSILHCNLGSVVSISF